MNLTDAEISLLKRYIPNSLASVSLPTDLQQKLVKLGYARETLIGLVITEKGAELLKP